jgi:predicted ArsR family transcriptional regulator
MLALSDRPVKTLGRATADGVLTRARRPYAEPVGPGSPSGEDRTARPAAAVAAVAALVDDSRRRMYDFIRAARRPVSREEAAASVGISRKLAAFHLDKLVEVGLLQASFAPVGGIRRVGRTPKVYEPTDTGVRISIPERHPELLAELLVDAVQADPAGRTARQTAVDLARQYGERLGAARRTLLRPGRLGVDRALTALTALLAEHGFEPDRDGPARLRLRNCPFQPLAERAPELVCALNHSFIAGMIDGLQATRISPMLTPRPGECCVRLTAVG